MLMKFTVLIIGHIWQFVAHVSSGTECSIYVGTKLLSIMNGSSYIIGKIRYLYTSSNLEETKCDGDYVI